MGNQLGTRVIDALDMRQTTKLNNQLELMKYLAMTVWPYIFGEKILKLTTNNHGLFEMIDTQFRFFARLSSDDTESKEYKNTR